MQTAQHVAARARLVVLHKANVWNHLVELGLVEALEEIPAVVPINLGLEQDHPRRKFLDYAHLSQIGMLAAQRECRHNFGPPNETSVPKWESTLGPFRTGWFPPIPD